MSAPCFHKFGRDQQLLGLLWRAATEAGRSVRSSEEPPAGRPRFSAARFGWEVSARGGGGCELAQEDPGRRAPLAPALKPGLAVSFGQGRGCRPEVGKCYFALPGVRNSLRKEHRGRDESMSSCDLPSADRSGSGEEFAKPAPFLRFCWSDQHCSVVNCGRTAQMCRRYAPPCSSSLRKASIISAGSIWKAVN
ncbi:hypothetical protein SKAU_G00398990 [Synaphobranchus kaupii]|uniref:Uncharacterized protein n=1 Tax=Synaphobranchus kaupii TaxID=118154 RepID=A0A9Q1IBD5_SYNKA|nr:hypothetical protein SKAU_G00398990 [Synaphobranchus kaupii]